MADMIIIKIGNEILKCVFALIIYKRYCAMKKYCIFDLDGTLVDSMDEWAAKMLSILKSGGVPYPENIIQTITPLGDRKTAELFREMGVKGSTEEIIERMNSYAYEAYSKRIKLKPFVSEFLHKLCQNGHVCAVLTASPHVTTDICLKHNGVFGLFEKIYSVNDFGLVKSQPEIYFKAAEGLGADISEITFFDDNAAALSAAKTAGLECIGVYDKYSDSDTDKIKKLADRYVKSFGELL